MKQFTVKGRGYIATYDHPDLIVARKHNPNQVQTILNELYKSGNGKLDTSDYVISEEGEWTGNLITDEGKAEILDRITSNSDNDPTSKAWYVGLFSSDSTPTTSWDGDWGAAAGGDATEFTDYDEATRQEIAFDAATGTAGSRYSTTNGTLATITVSAGVTDVNIYGFCIADQNTKQYDSGSGILLSALRFPNVKVFNAGQVKTLGYEIYIP